MTTAHINKQYSLTENTCYTLINYVVKEGRNKLLSMKSMLKKLFLKIILQLCARAHACMQYALTSKIPFIPTEKEIDQLIAGCSKNLATFIQLLKETAMRSGEAQKLTWADVDVERKVIRVTPEKGSNPRIFKVSTKLIQVLKALPKTSEKVFPASCNAINLHQQRKRVARKLQNPRLLRIHFHTLRHWKATILYHQTKDILYVKEFLGHKSIECTLIYIQLVKALFQESDEFTVRVAETLDEATKLLEAGYP